MTRVLLTLGLALHAYAALAQEWAIVSKSSRAEAGAPFELTVIAPPGQTLPPELKDLGKAVDEFKKGMKGDDDKPAARLGDDKATSDSEQRDRDDVAR